MLVDYILTAKHDNRADQHTTLTSPFNDRWEFKM